MYKYMCICIFQNSCNEYYWAYKNMFKDSLCFFSLEFKIND